MDGMFDDLVPQSSGVAVTATAPTGFDDLIPAGGHFDDLIPPSNALADAWAGNYKRAGQTALRNIGKGLDEIKGYIDEAVPGFLDQANVPINVGAGRYQPSKDDSPIVGIAKGVSNKINDLVESIGTPAMAATGAIGGIVPALGKPIAAAFLIDTARNLPAAAEQVKKVYDNPQSTPQERVEADLNFGSLLGFSHVLSKHILSKAPVGASTSLSNLKPEDAFSDLVPKDLQQPAAERAAATQSPVEEIQPDQLQLVSLRPTGSEGAKAAQEIEPIPVAKESSPQIAEPQKVEQIGATTAVSEPPATPPAVVPNETMATALRAIESERGLQLNKDGEPAAFIVRDETGPWKINDPFKSKPAEFFPTAAAAVQGAVARGLELDPRALNDYAKPTTYAAEPSGSAPLPSEPTGQRSATASESADGPVQASSATSDQLARESARRRVAISIPDSPVGVPDLIDFTKEQGGVNLPRKGARTAEHDDVTAAVEKYYGGRLANTNGALSADEIAQYAYEGGLIKEPTPSAYWDALDKNIAERPRTREAIRSEQRRLMEEENAARANALPKLRRGENQGDLLSQQTEDLSLMRERGSDYEARQREAEANAREAIANAQESEKNQRDLFAPEVARQRAMNAAAAAEPNTAQALGLVAGRNPFIEQDVIPKIKQVGHGIAASLRQVRNIFSPTSAGREALRQGNIVRENTAALARKSEIALARLHDASKLFNWTSNTFNLDVINRLE
ncbi:MAG: hypothetical protein M3160_10095, partial [Candidatus Eremiobacteraeota bacterium]|nr:hypothetical protein [Candidatus Eremiobacteraeota bacterium]